MRKQSMIGGGEFEFEQHKLEERFNNRQTFLQIIRFILRKIF